MFSGIASVDGRYAARRYLLLLFIGTVGIFLPSVATAQPPLAMTYKIPAMLHNDPVETDAELTLRALVEQTVAHYPDSTWLTALEEEAAALSRRSESWFSAAPKAALRFQEATSGTLHHADATVEMPLWNAGQRSAEQKLAQLSQLSADQQAQAMRLRVAGLVRMALWDMALEAVRHEQAQIQVQTYEKLLVKIQRRVVLGDLPFADQLLAHSELLQKHSSAVLAEAEWMHAKKRYQTITQTTKIPANFQEQRTALQDIQANHPALLAINIQIERQQGQLNALKREGSGPTQLTLGINSDRPSGIDPRSNNTESFNIMVNMPFGGAVHLAPKLAAATVELNRLYADREFLYRNLEQAYHEATHNLEIDRIEMEIAENLKNTAEQHLAMMDKAFEAGEIGLIDWLKFHARTEQARLNAKEHAVMLQRDLAFYNQAVGIMP